MAGGVLRLLVRGGGADRCHPVDPGLDELRPGLEAWAYRQDQLPSAHPVAADIPDIEAVEVNFDGITYAKGASVLKQLVAYAGRDRFLAGVRGYFGRHAFGNATLADLLASLERASGRDLTSWSKSWLETAGVDTFRPSYELGSDGRFAEFSVLQDAPAEHPELRPHRIAIGLYDRAGTPADSPPPGRTGHCRSGDSGTGADWWEKLPDLILVNDDDLTYAKIRLDPHSLRTVIASIADLDDQLAATLCWSAAWDMTRDDEMRARDFIALVLSGAPSIGQVAVLEQVLGQASTAARGYGDPAWREHRPGTAGKRASETGSRRPSRVLTISSPTAGLSPGSPPHPPPSACSQRTAGRHGVHPGRPGRRHRPALAAAAPAGEPGPGRPGSDRG